MSLVAVTRNRRVYVLEYRLHHGFASLVAIALGIIGVVHDWPDRRDWWPRR